MENKKRKMQLIANTTSRNNTKCKRKSNLFKKSIELNKLCGQEILLIIYDQEFDKMYQYQSDDTFDVGRAKDILERGVVVSVDGPRKRRRKPIDTTRVYCYSNKDIAKFGGDENGNVSDSDSD